MCADQSIHQLPGLEDQQRGNAVDLELPSDGRMRQRPADSRASCSITGAIARHGGHQVAQQSMRIGVFPPLATSAAKFASVMATGPVSSGSGEPHLPHFGVA
jgi:hypothetical protein